MGMKLARVDGISVRMGISNMFVKAKGILRHQFFGSYSAVIALEFSNEGDAKDALETLVGNWKEGNKHNHILVCVVDSEGIEQFKAKYNPKCFPCEWRHCKGKVHDIDGVDHSIDVGSPFEVSIEVANKNQLKLF